MAVIRGIRAIRGSPGTLKGTRAWHEGLTTDITDGTDEGGKVYDAGYPWRFETLNGSWLNREMVGSGVAMGRRRSVIILDVESVVL